MLGLPRGGVQVAFEVAKALHAPLDVFVVRKLGTPGNPELAMGAIATGATLHAAIRALKMQHPVRLVVGVPVCSEPVLRGLKSEVDEFIVLMVPEPFHGVGAWYKNFNQTSDEEVSELLARARIE